MGYYKRYLDGEYEPVWKELIQCGPEIRTEPLRSDANDVAKVIAEQGYKNLSLIYHRLVDLGYQFADPKSALLESSSHDVRLLNNAEGKFGVLPFVVRAWYERVASVDFSQAQSQVFGEADNGQNTEISVSGLGLNPVLVFLSIPNCMALHQRLMEDEDNASSNWLETLLPTGGWASNCNPKGFRLPDPAFDGALYNEGFGDVYFVQELRGAFRWGGFPFWQRLIDGKRFSSPLRRNPDFARLLPTLVDGLLGL